MTAKSEKKSHVSKVIGVLLVLTSILAILMLYALDITFFYEPKYLVGVTNTFFTAIIPLVVAFFAVKIYLRNGSLGVLLMGCGMLGFGLCAGSSGWLRVLPGGANFNVTIYNIGALLGSLCHFAGATISSSGKSYRWQSGNQKLAAIPACSVIILFAVLISFATGQHVIPPFFIQESGFTAVRQVVLGLAIFLYALSSLFFMNGYLRTKSDFLYWYSLCLAMLAVGLFAFFIEKIVGCPLGWAGRSSNYVGAIFSLIAIQAAVRSGKSEGLPLEEVISSFFVDAEANYRSLIETATDAIISFDQDNRIILWNSSAEKIFGYTKAEATGSPIFGMFIPEEHAKSLKELVETSRGMSSQSTVEIVGRHKNGDLFPIELSAFARDLPNGRVNTCILRDITERKQAEHTLREAKNEAERYGAEMATLMDALPAAVFIAHDVECRYMSGSRFTQELLGLPATANFSKSAPPPERPAHFRPMKDGLEIPPDELPVQMAAKGREIRDYEFELLFDDGKSRHLLGNATPLRNAEGQIYGSVGAFVDMTGRKRAEEELHKAKEEAEKRAKELEALMDAVPALIWVTRDTECLSMTGNRAVYEFLGMPDGANVSKTAPETERPVHFRALRNGMEIPLDELPMQRAAKGEGMQDYELEYAFDDGTSKITLGNTTPLYDAAGHVYGAIAAFVDITERKQMEEELRKSRDQLELRVQERTGDLKKVNDKLLIEIQERRRADEAVRASEREFRLLADAMPQIVWITRPDGWNIYFNQRWLDYTGQTLEESYGHGWNKPFHPDDQQRAWDAWQNATKNGAVYDLECRLRRADGVYRWWLIRGAPVLDERGTVLKWFGTCTDIDERKQNAEKVNAERQRFYEVLETLPVYICLLTPDYHVPFANRVFSERFGESTGLRCFEHLFGRSEPCEVCDTYKVLKTMAPHQWEWTGPDSRNYSVFDFPFTDTDGSSLILEMGIDITERKQAEAELSATIARLELVNAELQEFAHVASHDLQEPLRKIQTFCDMAKKRCAPVLDSTSNDYLDRVLNSVSRMRQLLSDLLDFSRVATRPEPFKEIDLIKIVREAADVFEASVKEIGCQIEIANMPAIDADESQMLRLFQNLIGNALKFRGDENPRIKIYGKLDKKKICEIFVKDNGIGFDRKYAELIFKPFQRLHRRSEYEGTGMGLAICRKIVERHGGNIRAESEPGKGSTFIIRLPAKQTGGRAYSD